MKLFNFVWVCLATWMLPCQAQQYLSTEQAQHKLFPQADAFLYAPVQLNAEQRKKIEKAAGVRMRFAAQPVWKVMQSDQFSGWFMLDEVYGKHEFITYALALDVNGAVQALEILDYRETHGGDVMNANWRAQFIGKKNGAKLKLDDDIINISGATLSAKHLSEGVRRLLVMHEVVLK